MNEKLTSLLIAAVALGASHPIGVVHPMDLLPKNHAKVRVSTKPHQGERERARRRKQMGKA